MSGLSDSCALTIAAVGLASFGAPLWAPILLGVLAALSLTRRPR